MPSAGCRGRWPVNDIDDDEEDAAALSVLAVMVGLDPLEVVDEAVAGSSDLGPRERVCSVGWLVHVAGPCWCNDIPTPTLVEPVPRPDRVWIPWDTAMIKAGIYS